MKYHEFCSQFREHLLEDKTLGIEPENITFYPEGYQAGDDPEDQDFVRSTNLKYYSEDSDVLKGDFMTLTIGGDEEVTGISRFSMLYLFEEYVASGWDRVWLVLHENMKMARRSSVSEVVKQLHDYEFIKDRLIIRPINYPNNRHLLDDHIFRVHGDIALVVYVIVRDDTQGLDSMKLMKTTAVVWGKSEEEVWDFALQNTYAKAPPRIYLTPWDCVNPPHHRGTFMEPGSDIISLRKTAIPTITTTRQLNGAIAMFYPGVREKLAELLGGSYYASFTSTDDVKLHHVDTISPKTVKGLLEDVNRVFGEESLLSREVFLYDREKGTFELVDSYSVKDKRG